MITFVSAKEQRQTLVSYHPHPRSVYDDGDGVLPLHRKSRRWRFGLGNPPSGGLYHRGGHHRSGAGGISGEREEDEENN